jgi:hypothetical protein
MAEAWSKQVDSATTYTFIRVEVVGGRSLTGEKGSFMPDLVFSYPICVLGSRLYQGNLSWCSVIPEKFGGFLTV